MAGNQLLSSDDCRSSVARSILPLEVIDRVEALVGWPPIMPKLPAAPPAMTPKFAGIPPITPAVPNAPGGPLIMPKAPGGPPITPNAPGGPPITPTAPAAPCMAKPWLNPPTTLTFPLNGLAASSAEALFRRIVAASAASLVDF